MSQVDPADVPVPQNPVPKASEPPRWLVVGALVALLIFVAAQGRTLWREWWDLQSEMGVVRRSAVIGYPNIHPLPSYARRPENWFHDEGKYTLIWAGWKHGDGHQWFRVDRGDVDK